VKDEEDESTPYSILVVRVTHVLKKVKQCVVRGLISSMLRSRLLLIHEIQKILPSFIHNSFLMFGIYLPFGSQSRENGNHIDLDFYDVSSWYIFGPRRGLF